VSDVRPFSARSLTLSVLLGLPAGRLPTPALVRLAELFGIAPGTQRTALSRMVGAGELVADGAGYALGGRLLDRKWAQDVGREPPPGAWDGTWWIVTAVTSARTLAARRELRTAMVNARLGELRADTWMRPANTKRPAPPGDTVVIGGRIDGPTDAELVDRLWDLDAVRVRGAELVRRLASGRTALVGPGALPTATLLAADVVRYLREEPYLPPALTPDDWPVDRLRRAYQQYDRDLGQLLRQAIGA
jgi:phenylacetic acid degradation operon negative regulatory protein